MRRSVALAALSAGVAMGIVRRLMNRATGRPPQEEAGRWLVVTVNRPPEEVSGRLPEPLAGLRDSVEMRIDTAPGGRGTELAVRPRNGLTSTGRVGGQSPREALRRALRDAKSILETGEVLRPDTPPTTRSTPGGRLLELATRRAGGEGRL
ncbi:MULTISPECIES: hypothetical protein [Thermomonospora]|uniref:Uncharacterized protein n=1 Tax=Thermomonospora cellulosilytica TaxID=1411118 RepID=A0A7W3MY27_9ACTN|nr:MULTISPECIES: hypothetical protein [Thermomonospora]MBA9004025.1 hypothetical protein [Thermomonospora cellulosilytica]